MMKKRTFNKQNRRRSLGRVVALSATPAPVVADDDQPAETRNNRTRSWIGGAIAASLMLIILIVTFSMVFSSPDDGSMIVATALGEQRNVTLEDGSIVYVNTQSQIEILYSEEERSVELMQGEALFEVEKDPTRPFRVIAGETVAEALGATFNVRLIDNEAKVSVVEGTVAFGKTGLAFDVIEREAGFSLNEEIDEAGAEPRRLEGGRVILTAGEMADLGEATPAPRVVRRDVEAISAWAVRKLMFDEDDLDTIVREFNRYNRQRLAVASPSLEDERFSGIFAADDPESFVAFLELTSDIDGVEVGS